MPSRPAKTTTCQSREHRRARVARPVDPAVCRRAAAIFAVLGDANRLRLLSLLRQGELCVSQIAALVDDNLPAVSQRLKLLRSERVVVTRREGKHIYYALADRHVEDLISNALEHATE